MNGMERWGRQQIGSLGPSLARDSSREFVPGAAVDIYRTDPVTTFLRPGASPEEYRRAGALGAVQFSKNSGPPKSSGRKQLRAANRTEGTQAGEMFVLKEIAGFVFGYFIFSWCWRAGGRGRGCANHDVPRWRRSGLGGPPSGLRDDRQSPAESFRSGWARVRLGWGSK